MELDKLASVVNKKLEEAEELKGYSTKIYSKMIVDDAQIITVSLKNCDKELLKKGIIDCSCNLSLNNNLNSENDIPGVASIIFNQIKDKIGDEK